MSKNPKVGQTVMYKTAGISSSGRVVRVGKSTVDVAGPGTTRGRGAHGPIQLARSDVTTILKSDIKKINPDEEEMTMRKKTPAQLQREIDEALRQRATEKSPAQVGREITEGFARRAFEEAKAEEASLERESSDADADLAAVTTEHARILGVPPRSPIGLIPDAVRATPEYRAAKERASKAFARLRSFNATFVKRFAKELRAERSERTRQRESRSGSH